MSVEISLLSVSDVTELLAFELENRGWFEQFVEPRGDDFYTPDSVKAQILEFLLLHRCGEMYPMLIRDQHGNICGRINIHRINREKKSGELGYRVGQSFVSKGIASQAVEKFMAFLASESALDSVTAYVLTGNTGSEKVLQKNGFNKVDNIINYSSLHGELRDAVKYVRGLI
ncbi:Putative ribosomal N-acetyltransferase YdaF [Vibrio aerogenes CECT 7868]|uniref:Putative ribosomal N-acetyltransferase YdaF n=1 Tax=Vibrio aerogenes CECT 7868 TaxID=1216006 RepID=A0A1M6A683_9VIBR|nr:GNAT family N-acetyltransferase [Vibrio aerogenes]SHI31919.1 Putative ribosomal N-acetyltransferase YdaF [Vibrio aerogenes CECT 7868]